MWPGLVGKGDGPGQEPPISLERMLDLTAAAEVDGQKFDGIDYFLFLPHTDPEANDSQLRKTRRLDSGIRFPRRLAGGPGLARHGGGSAMGTTTARKKFLSAVRMACRIAGAFDQHGVRKYGVDPHRFGGVRRRGVGAKIPSANTKRIAETFREACRSRRITENAWPPRAKFAGPACTAGGTWWSCWKRWTARKPSASRPTWPTRTFTRWAITRPKTPAAAARLFGLSEFDAAYEKMADALRPWTIDFHVAQNDGNGQGVGLARQDRPPLPADDPNGKLDIVRDAGSGCATTTASRRRPSSTSAGTAACSPTP